MATADDYQDHESCPGGTRFQRGVGFVCMGCGVVIESDPNKPAGEAVPAGDPILSGLPETDLSKPLTPDQALAHISDCVNRLEKGAAFHRICIEEKYAADIKYEIAYARALVQAAGAADLRRAQALIRCRKEYEAKTIAEMKVKAVAATMHDIRAMLSGYQSMSKTVNSTYQAAAQAYGNY